MPPQEEEINIPVTSTLNAILGYAWVGENPPSSLSVEIHYATMSPPLS